MLDWIDFGAAGTGWCRIDERPLLILVGLTGVGKTTTVKALKTAGMDFVLLPNRRAITDAVLIPAMQRANGEPVTPVQDRSRRFAYTRQYRAHFPGGMAYALSQMVVKQAMLSATAVLLFDGLRGANEVAFAAQNLPQAHFLFLDAPDTVRLQRLRKRNDAFDQVCTNGTEVETAVAIINGERQNYDPQATLTALQEHAPQRLIYADTTSHTPDEIAQLLVACYQDDYNELRKERI